MIKKLLKLLFYKKSPAGAFALFHPRKALKWGLVLFLGKKLLGLGKSRDEREETSGRTKPGA